MGLDPSDVGLRLQTIVPGQETVTLYLRDPPPATTYTAYTLNGVRRRPSNETFPSVPSLSAVPVNDMQFDIYRPTLDAAGVPTAALPGYQDYIAAAASPGDPTLIRWNINTVKTKSKGTFWQVHCTSLDQSN